MEDFIERMSASVRKSLKLSSNQLATIKEDIEKSGSDPTNQRPGAERPDVEVSSSSSSHDESLSKSKAFATQSKEF